MRKNFIKFWKATTDKAQLREPSQLEQTKLTALRAYVPKLVLRRLLDVVLGLGFGFFCF